MPLETADLDTIKGLITESIGPAVNNMFTARLSTVEKKIEKQLKETTDGFSKALDEKLAAFKPAGGEPQDDGKGGKGKKDLELESLKKRFEEMQVQLTESRQVADAEREKNRTAQLQQAVTDKLEKHGQIQGVAARMALGSLTAYGRIGWGEGDDVDKIVFRGDDGIVTDLDVGLKQWLKTDEAKIFLSPTGVRGSGSRPGGLDPRAGSAQLSKEQKAVYLNDALERALT